MDRYLRGEIAEHPKKEQFFALLEKIKVKATIINSVVKKQEHDLLVYIRLPKLPGAFTFQRRE